jgi:hypothetical protein
MKVECNPISAGTAELRGQTDPTEISYPELRRIWRNQEIPVVYRPGGLTFLLVHVPFQRYIDFTGNVRPQNIIWLRGKGKHKIHFNQQYRAWEITPSRLNDVVDRCLKRYGKCWLIQRYRPMEKCAPACWNAKGYECECSCMGSNHGSGRELTHVVSETFAFEMGERQLAARLLTRGIPETSNGDEYDDEYGDEECEE